MKGSEPMVFDQLQGYPETRILKDAPLFTFDRSVKFGHRNLLTYKIVSDWVIAEYKSQGDLQENLIHRGDVETFRYFAINPPRAWPKHRLCLMPSVRRATPINPFHHTPTTDTPTTVRAGEEIDLPTLNRYLSTHAGLWSGRWSKYGSFRVDIPI